jgi:hypothetical protein
VPIQNRTPTPAVVICGGFFRPNLTHCQMSLESGTVIKHGKIHLNVLRIVSDLLNSALQNLQSDAFFIK